MIIEEERCRGSTCIDDELKKNKVSMIEMRTM
jgi:hypothetical protein